MISDLPHDFDEHESANYGDLDSLQTRLIAVSMDNTTKSSVTVGEVVEKQHGCYDILAGRKHTLGKKPDKIAILNNLLNTNKATLYPV